MKHNPFINSNEEEGSFSEKIHLRHALFSKEGEFPDVDREWEKFQKRIEANQATHDVADDVTEEAVVSRRPVILRWMSVAAVAAVVVAVLGIAYFSSRSGGLDAREVYVAQESSLDRIIVTNNTTGEAHNIVSPTYSATPRPIHVTGNSVTDTLTVEVPAGQELQIVLPDSTRVWLWANSKLKYPENFTSSTRTVELTGEAFFDVATDSLCPFIVQTQYFITRVYGTEFVVRAYNPSTAFILLVDGLVSVDVPELDASAELQPGQAASVQAGDLQLQAVDTYPWEQWRDGFFYFDEESLFKILLEIGRWYNITIISQNEKVLDKQLHFVADRTADPQSVVEALNSLVDDADITIDDGQIIIR